MLSRAYVRVSHEGWLKINIPPVRVCHLPCQHLHLPFRPPGLPRVRKSSRDDRFAWNRSRSNAQEQLHYTSWRVRLSSANLPSGYYILIVCLCALAVSVSMTFLAAFSPPAGAFVYFFSPRLPKTKVGSVSVDSDPQQWSLLWVRSYKLSDCSDVPLLKAKETPKQLTPIRTFLEEIAEEKGRREVATATGKLLKEAEITSFRAKNEWGRVFTRFDYIFLFVFEVLNLVALGIFSRQHGYRPRSSVNSLPELTNGTPERGSSCLLLTDIFLPTPDIMLAVLLLLLRFLSSVDSYQKYADPVVVAEPSVDGVYEFDMVVTKKLTMSYHSDNPWLHGTPVDYHPNREAWTRRNPDQVVDCFDNSTMFPETNDGDANDLEDVLTLDGLHKRVITINGVTPGIPLVVPLGAEVLLKVRNNLLMNSVTIHIHGLSKQDLWYTDGVAFVQQCPISSTNYYEYRFIADTVGTHWYHGHMQSDRGDGLIGGFIVVDPKDRSVPVDRNEKNRIVPSREYSVILQDWATKTQEEAWMQLDDKTMKWMYGYDNNTECWQPTRTMDGGNVGGAVPISALTINDKGWFSQDDIQNQPHKLPVERFRINQSEPVLFRVVNGGVSQELMIHVEGHAMTVVSADGEEVVPQPIDRLIIFPGERYDILVKGLTNPTKKNYKMIVETIQYYWWNWTVMDTTYGIAFLEYDQTDLDEDTSKPNLLPTDCTPQKHCTVLNCPFLDFPSTYNFSCISYDQLEHPHPEKIDPAILQDTQFSNGFEEHFINMHFDSHVDGFKYEYPTGIPYFNRNRMDKISKACNETLCPKGANKYDRNCNCFFHKEHKLGNIVQLTIFNMGTGGFFGSGYAHPFHVHGQHYSVMKIGWPTYNASGMIDALNPDIDCNGPEAVCDGAVWRNASWMNGAIPGMNTKSPTSRDTITLPVGGYITIRFRAVNPGWWFAHCHLVLHHMGGTAYAFKVGADDQIPEPPPDFPKSCGYYEHSSFSTQKPSQPATQTPSRAPSLLFCFSLASALIVSLWV